MKLYGFELEASLRMGKRFQATASYVFQQVDADKTQYDETWTYYLPELLPKHKIKFLGRYETWKDGLIQLSGRFEGERQTQKGGTLDAYIVLDMGFEQRFSLCKQDFTFGVYANNLLGEEYQEQAGYQMPRQVYGVRLTARF